MSLQTIMEFFYAIFMCFAGIWTLFYRYFLHICKVLLNIVYILALKITNYYYYCYYYYYSHGELLPAVILMNLLPAHCSFNLTAAFALWLFGQHQYYIIKSPSLASDKGLYFLKYIITNNRTDNEQHKSHN